MVEKTDVKYFPLFLSDPKINFVDAYRVLKPCDKVNKLELENPIADWIDHEMTIETIEMVENSWNVDWCNNLK